MDTHEDSAGLDRAMRAFGEAWARGDLAALDALLAPDYTHGDVFGGFQGRAAWLAYAAKRAGLPTRIAFEDVSTRFHGDVAIVTGVNVLTDLAEPRAGDYRTGVRRLRFTQVWVRRDGKWQRSAFQATWISAAAAA